MRRLLRILLPLMLGLAAMPAGAAARTPALAPARELVPRQLLVKFEGRRPAALSLPRGSAVGRAAAILRRNPRVAYAEPNYIATASAIERGPFDPDDSGSIEAAAASAGEAGRWAYKQWNFLAPEGPETAALPTSPGGIDAPGAWRNLIEAGRPGGAGIVVAVLDSGIAYRSYGSEYRPSPDFGPAQFLPGYDFVGHDRLPLDQNGHGTHVAGTIAEKTGNGFGLTGLAYGAKLMPVRVLNREGEGRESQIAKGIRYAVVHHADVINMSFNFACGEPVPMVDEALRFAYRSGVVAIASGGNYDPRHPGRTACVSEPATGPRVIGVGAATEGGCISRYSLTGTAIDIVAPGGGAPRRGCPSVLHRPIYQVTLRHGSTSEFSIPAYYVGTSMAAAHVSGAAALVLASRAVDPKLEPRQLVDQVTGRLRGTARDLGLPEPQQGAGLLDVGRATEPVKRAS